MVLDISDAKADGLTHLKLARNGHVATSQPWCNEYILIFYQTVLVPQPSDDPNDPLNWSHTKKGLILGTISVAAFLAEFQCTTGNPCILLQGAEWGISPDHVNYANNLNVLMV